MIFAKPLFLWGWLFLIFGWLAILYWQHYCRQQLAKLIDSKLQHRLLSGKSKHQIFLKNLLFLLSICWIFTALARPQWGVNEVPNILKGRDIVIAFDISKSMLAQDVSPNRLIRAKWKIKDFLKYLQGERVALIAFAGSAFLQSPLTKDYEALEMFIDSLEADLLPTQGTSLVRAIEMALQLFQNNSSDSNMLLLITDGEDHSAKMQSVLDQAQQSHLNIFILGIGTPEGAPIPEVSGGFLKNRQGELVISRLEEAQLQDIAQRTGGLYFRSRSDEQDLQRIYQKITTIDGDPLRQGSTRSEPIERFQWALLLALICLFSSALISIRQNFKPQI